MARRLRALRLVHPFPSFLNASLVAVLAFIAGPDPWRALTLAGGMLGMQFAIGATNDLADRAADARVKPWKPIPAGLISIRSATGTVVVSAAAGLALAAAVGPQSLALWLAMLACGLAYNFRLKATPLAWACFSVAFALLPIYAWHGASGEPPPQWQFVVALAVLAGPTLALANGLADLEIDAAARVLTPAVRLGRSRTLVLMAMLTTAIYGAAWVALSSVAAQAGVLLLGLASGGAAIGCFLSTRASREARQRGWSLQAVSIALLAASWLLAVG